MNGRGQGGKKGGKQGRHSRKEKKEPPLVRCIECAVFPRGLRMDSCRRLRLNRFSAREPKPGDGTPTPPIRYTLPRHYMKKAPDTSDKRRKISGDHLTLPWSKPLTEAPRRPRKELADFQGLPCQYGIILNDPPSTGRRSTGRWHRCAADNAGCSPYRPVLPVRDVWPT